MSRIMGKAISVMVLFTLLAKVLGFVRELLLSYFFGTTGISDAYLISQTIPGTIFQFVGTGLTTCFIPVYYKVLNEHNRKECDDFTNKVLTLVLSFSTVAMAVVWLFTPLVVKLFAAGFTGDTLDLAVLFTRIGISSLYFSSVIYVYNSYLQANNIFGFTAAAAIPNSIAIICSIVLGACWNILALSVGSTLATAVQMAFLFIPIHKLQFRIKLNFHWKDSYLKHFFYLLGPVILGVSVNEINVLVDKSVASQVAVGGISALTYANSLIMLIQGGFAQPIATVFYPRITENISKGNKKIAQDNFQTALLVLLVLLLPITVGFLVLPQEIIAVFFGRGAFDENAIVLTATALSFYSFGIVFIGVRELLARYYYAYGNTKLPMINAAIGMVVNIVLNLTLSKVIGIGGLALATSVSAAVTVLLMWGQCRKLAEGAGVKLYWREIVKITVAAIIMGIIVCFAKSLFPIGDFFGLFVLVFIGATTYGITIFALRVEILMEFANKVLKRGFKWKD
ncbi:murein biosynthesis integral membrane protein MurJ [Allofournierella massiliensis]|uniref:murein biosynthesis integral membrane protein MurJ n=2 Tax=Allofournierella massiliensis TaxID=1650663 RepID=UPI00356940C4